MKKENIFKYLRKKAGLSIAELSHELEISPAAISRYENTLRPRIPKLYILKRYKDFFQISYDILLNMMTIEEVSQKFKPKRTCVFSNDLYAKDPEYRKLVNQAYKSSNSEKFIEEMMKAIDK